MALRVRSSGPNGSSVGNLTEGTYTNEARPGIVWAHSCLTADGRNGLSMGGSFVTQENGALAWIGFTRSCWIGTGVGGYAAGFWCGVHGFRRMGPPVSLALNTAGDVDYGQVTLMTLLGDPEMPVWTSPPGQLEVTVTPLAFGGPEYLSVMATDGGRPVAGLMVTITQGWTNSRTDPLYWQSTVTGWDGRASLEMAGGKSRPVSSCRASHRRPAGSTHRS